MTMKKQEDAKAAEAEAKKQEDAKAAEKVLKVAAGKSLVINKKIFTGGIELQASQVLQTGKLELKNKDGVTTYELDFKPKASHFPTVTTDWSDPAADALGDLSALGDVIKSDSGVRSTILIFGSSAWSNFQKNDDVKELLDNRRIEIGDINPMLDDTGAIYRGRIWAGNYELEMWSYDADYEDPQTGNPVSYVATDNVVMLSEKTRLDKTAAEVPLVKKPDSMLAPLIPNALQSRAQNQGYVLTPNVYASPDNTALFGQLYSRPLLVPVQIDGFGCLTTKM